MLPARKGPWTEIVTFLRRPEVWSRVGVCLLTTMILWLVTFGWAPPFPWRVRTAPIRDLHARTTFRFEDAQATAEARNRAYSNILCQYENDSLPLEDLRQTLFNDLFEIVSKDFDEIEESGVWSRFQPPSRQYSLQSPAPVILPAAAIEPGGTLPANSPDADDPGPRLEDAELSEAERARLSERRQRETAFLKFRDALINDERLELTQKTISAAFVEIDKNGLLEDLQHEKDRGSIVEIESYPKGNPENAHRVSVTDARISQAAPVLKQNLQQGFKLQSELINEPSHVAENIFQWLRPRLPVTLKWNNELSRRISDEAKKSVQPIMKQYLPGDTLPKLSAVAVEGTSIAAGIPLDKDDINLLLAEYEAEIGAMNSWDRVFRSLFYFGFYGVMFALVSSVLYYRDPHILNNIWRFTTLVGLMAVTLILMWLLTRDVAWRAEVVPVMIFAMAIAIAYNIELSFICSALVAISFTATHGFGLAEFVILTAASSTTAMLCRRIRSRTKLSYVGMAVAAVVFATVIGVQYLLGQPLGTALLTEAVWFAGAAAMTGLFMTGLLPFLESWFDIQTDTRLLELSDANHPLLRELVQRAPGTYNHSINVASVSEAAADAIGANGLLCRVGAYFHDIGKIRKPDYFIENQSGENRHDDLEPSMSALVITAHVKDGAEIGRKHKLPRRIIDLIEQHHGTTMVEYFFHKAQKKSEADPDAPEVDESEFRYAGPKPQTLESGVMMLADAVESASRALREPTPSRLNTLVREIGKKKLDDGQFDECGITLKQLNTVQESLIKSLNAMYHARVKYPEKDKQPVTGSTS